MLYKAYKKSTQNRPLTKQKGLISKFIFATSICFLSYFSFSQQADLQFKHLTNEEGLSQHSVNAIVQDHLGLLWFGTNEGLNKYDGCNFTIYKQEFNDTTSLINSNINTLFRDKDNRLWVGTHDGVCYYDHEKDIFIRINETSGDYYSGIFQSSDGDMYFYSYLHFFEYNIESRTLTELYSSSQVLDLELFTNGILEYEKDKFWITTKEGLYELNATNNNLKPVQIKGSLGAKKIYMKTMFQDSRGNIWIGTIGRGLLQLMRDSSDNSLRLEQVKTNENTQEFKANAILAIAEDSKNNLWIGNDDGHGLYILSLDDHSRGVTKIYNYKYSASDKYSLSSDVIQCFHLDKTGTMWLGNGLAGISYHNDYLFKFNTIRHVEGNQQGLSHQYVSCVLDETNFLWIGSGSTLDKYNKETKTWSKFILNASIGNSGITCILRDTRGTLWVGTWAGGLMKILNDSTGEFKSFYHNPHDSTTINSNNMFGMAEDTLGNIWVATMGGGVNVFNPDTEVFQRLFDSTGKRFIKSEWIKNIVRDKENNMWIATGLGLNYYNFKEDKHTRYAHDPNDENSLSSNSMVCVYVDKNGNVWGGTERGLSLFNPETENFRTFQVNDGVTSTVVRSILEDQRGNLWVSTNNGILEIQDAINRPERPIIKRYNVDDGLQNKEFNSRSCSRGADGTMYFGGVNGLNYFQPDSIKLNINPPELIFTDFLLFNKPVEIGGKHSPITKHISLTKKITLNYDQSVMTFKYVGINYIASEKNVYKYMMKEFDKDWQYVGNKTDATYTNLNPGEYEFIVKAANNDGFWNEEGISISIVILPPWWQTTWFRILLFLLVASIILAIYYWRVNELEKQKKKLKMLVDKKTEELRRHAYELNMANKELEMRQQRVLEQAEELTAQKNELSRKNEDLQILNSTKDKFFSIIAHDLKNPFSSIIGLSEVLKIKYTKHTDEKRIQLIDLIHESGSRSYKLLENLLEWARAQTGRIKFSPETFFLIEIIIDLELLVQESMKSKGIKLIINIPEKQEIYGDKNMLKTIIRNLLTNAVKFCEDCNITLLSEDKGTYHKISIIDEGVGMDAQTANNLFKIEKSTQTQGTKGETGTGLGLIICKEFIEYHNGEISVESELGVGSTFSITVPKRI